jgi:hypothetical protein
VPETQLELLDSWKAIASYLRRDVRTVQRWEKALGLPVHRVPRSKLVFAYRNELEAWLGQQESARLAETPPVEASATTPARYARGSCSICWSSSRPVRVWWGCGDSGRRETRETCLESRP